MVVKMNHIVNTTSYNYYDNTTPFIMGDMMEVIKLKIINIIWNNYTINNNKIIILYLYSYKVQQYPSIQCSQALLQKYKPINLFRFENIKVLNLIKLLKLTKIRDLKQVLNKCVWGNF